MLATANCTRTASYNKPITHVLCPTILTRMPLRIDSIPVLCRVTALLLLALALPALGAPKLEDGYDAFERGDVHEAVAIWRELAEAGNQTAQLNLGQLYRTGRGVPQDDAEAVKWYIEAGRSGSEMARYTLKLMEREGRATEADVAKAFNGELPPDFEATQQAALTEPTTVEPATSPTATAAPTTPTATAAPTATSTTTTEPTTAATPPASATTTEPNEPRPPSTREWLGSLPPDGYVVQLIGSSRPDRLQDYRDKELQGVTPEPRVVLTYRAGKNWYLLLMGPYADPASARNAAAALPASVQKNQPWVRPVAGLPIPGRD